MGQNLGPIPILILAPSPVYFAARALTPRAIHLRPRPPANLGKQIVSELTKLHLEDWRLPDQRNCHNKASKSFKTSMGGVCTKHL